MNLCGFHMKSLLKAFLEILGGETSQTTRKPAAPAYVPQRYSTVVLGSRESGLRVAASGNMFVVVEPAGKRKWALMRCPCGCGEILALNLMHAHSPYWTVRVNVRGDATLHPSVDSTKCGAHFWLRNGVIVWFGSSGPNQA